MLERSKIVVLTGAGVSAESGIKTFRDADGLWEGHDVMQVASPEGWRKNRTLVLDFYNQRRRQLSEVQPNAAHTALVKLEEKYNTVIITQNVDDLHERAGSSNVIHLHGELRKIRPEDDRGASIHWKKDVQLGDCDDRGIQYRPDIVWFGEAVPMIEKATVEISDAEIVLIIGTSMQVYPAAGLVGYAPRYSTMHYIDPRPTISHELALRQKLRIHETTATDGIPKIVEELLKK